MSRDTPTTSRDTPTAARDSPTAAEETLISYFLGYFPDQDRHTAILFLQMTGWDLPDALDRFLIDREPALAANEAMPHAAAAAAALEAKPEDGPAVEAEVPQDAAAAIVETEPEGASSLVAITFPLKQLPAVDMNAISLILEPTGHHVKKKFVLPKRFYDKRDHHPKEGLSWLWNLHCIRKGGLLADEMGMGKTKQELYALLNFSSPKSFGTLEEFMKKFGRAILYGSYKDSTNEQLIDSAEAAVNFQDLIEEYFLRREKSEIVSSMDGEKMGEKDELLISLKLSSFQNKVYQALRTGNLINKRKKGEALVATMLLRRICNNLHHLTKEPSNEAINWQCSSKIQFIIILLERLIPKHKVLIFSQMRDVLNATEEVISSKHYKFCRMDGSTSAHDRKQIFHQKDGPQIHFMT